MCKVLYDQSQAPLELSIFSQFDDTDREPPVTEKTLSNLRRLFIHLKKIDPLPSLVPYVSTGGASLRSAVTQQPNRYWASSGQQQRCAYIVTGQGPRPRRVVRKWYTIQMMERGNGMHLMVHCKEEPWWISKLIAAIDECTLLHVSSIRSSVLALSAASVSTICRHLYRKKVTRVGDYVSIWEWLIGRHEVGASIVKTQLVRQPRYFASPERSPLSRGTSDLVGFRHYAFSATSQSQGKSGIERGNQTFDQACQNSVSFDVSLSRVRYCC